MSKAPRKTSSEEIPRAPVRSFADLIGFQDIITAFNELATRDRVPQVLLFEGRPAIGKRKLLARLAATIYCETRDGCGHCQGCHSVIHGYQPDLLWIENDGPIKVAEAEAIQEHLSYQSSGAQRVVVITDIEDMNDQAANRLLKTLEEPPPRTQFLISTSRARQLLATITSRLVRWHVQPPPIESSLRWLMGSLKEAGLAVSEHDAREALERYSLAPGRTLLALKMANSVEQEAQHRLASLLLKPLEGKDLHELQDLLKQQGWKANELAQHFELLLNRYYKWSLGLIAERPSHWPASIGAPDPRLLRQRRRILQQIYRGGGQGHNFLNAQLAAEALGSDTAF
jgi:DNA polymerase III delta prime subunit